MKSFKTTPMKVKDLFLSLVLLFTASTAFAQQPPQVVTPLQNGDKMLFIGNSFSDWGGELHNSVQNIIKASGTNLSVDFTFKVKGMGVLKEYATMEELGMMAEIKKGGWKYVVIQGWQDAIIAQDTMLKYLKELDDEVVKAGAKTILYEPHVDLQPFVEHKAISNATYERLRNEVSVFYASTLFAWDSMRVRYPDNFAQILYADDGGHQNNTGMALDAMTFYTILTQRSAETLKPTFAIRTDNPALYEEMAAIGYNTGKYLLKLNNSWIEDTEAPSIPGGLTASNKATDRFVLTWTPSTDDKGVLGYNIYRDGVRIGIATTPRFSVTGLSPETAYNMTVTAFDSEKKESAASAVLEVTTEPFVEVNLKGDLLKWEFTDQHNIATVEASTVMTGISSTPPSATIDKGSVFGVNGFKSNSFALGGQTATTLAGAISTNQYMTFSVAPQEGNSITIESVSFGAYSQNAKPEQARNFTLMSNIGGFTNGSQFDNIHCTTDQNTPPSQKMTITGHEDIETAVEFRIYVWGHNDVFEAFGIDNLIITGGVKTIPPPLEPTELAATNLTEEGFILSWKAAADALSYNVYIDGVFHENVNKTNINIFGNIGDVFSMTVSAVKAGDEESDQSEPLSVTIPDLHAPTVPTALTISEQSYYNFTLRWTTSDDNVGVTNYEVYTNGRSYGNTSDLSGFMPMPFLAPGTSYQVQVKALDAFGNESALSTAITATTLALPIPDDLAASEVTKNSFTLAWMCETEGVATDIQYNVYKDGTLYATVQNLSVEVAELLPSTTYNMTVKLIDGNGNESALSDALQVATEKDIAADNASRSGIIIYPNPSKGIITIACDGSEANTIYVYDNAGKLLRLIENAACQSDIDLSACPAGNYLIKVESGTAVYTEKLVIEK